MLEYIITHDNPKSPTSEAYRVLRTNILFSNVDRPPKTIVVTSFGNGEGKTTTVVNLAVTFLQQGSRVLLIDGDLRKPKIHSFFRLKNEDGLTNLLYSHENYRKYVKQDPVHENLDCDRLRIHSAKSLRTPDVRLDETIFGAGIGGLRRRFHRFPSYRHGHRRRRSLVDGRRNHSRRSFRPRVRRGPVKREGRA